jgi:hypothetical protein
MNDSIIFQQAAAHRGKRVEYFTIAWNNLEGIVGIGAGATAGTMSLLGFGIDRLIEITSGATLLWRMTVDADVESASKTRQLASRSLGCVSSDWPCTLAARR